MKYRVLRTNEFNEWLSREPPKSQAQIEKRIMHIQHDGHFGLTNDVEDGVLELKWKDGRRVYYVHLLEVDVLLLLGENKNGQSYDINKAKKILRKHAENVS